MNKTLEGYRQMAKYNHASKSMPRTRNEVARRNAAILDLLKRLDVAEKALESCRCVLSGNEGTSHYTAQEALAKINQEGPL